LHTKSQACTRSCRTGNCLPLEAEGISTSERFSAPAAERNPGWSVHPKPPFSVALVSGRLARRNYGGLSSFGFSNFGNQSRSLLLSCSPVSRDAVTRLDCYISELERDIRILHRETIKSGRSPLSHAYMEPYCSWPILQDPIESQ